MTTMVQCARAVGRAFAAGALLAVAGLAACEPGRDSAEEAAADPQLVPVPGDSTRLVYRSEVGEDLGVALAIVLDNSGSMKDRAEGDDRPKADVAREAIERMLDATDSAVARRPELPVQVALYVFARRVNEVLPMQPYQRDSVRAALARVPKPSGTTAIGRGMEEARKGLYRSGMYRKNLLVITDGENKAGRAPDVVAREIHARSEGGVRMYFVAFDVGEGMFDFAREVRGEVVSAANGVALGAALDSLYQGRVLAEALDAGEGTPAATAPQGAADAGQPRGDSTSQGRRSRRP